LAQVRPTIEPVYLYRYRSICSAERLARELEAIEERYSWCSNFSELNDPMEGSYELSLRVQKHPKIEVIKQKIFDDKMGVGICSFSETNDHSLMWAHYADQFRGICIEYDFQHLLKTLNHSHEFARVSYDERVYKVGKRNADESDLAKKILATKSDRWLYEREWRLFSPTKEKLHQGAKAISRVYFGNRISSDAKFQLVSLLQTIGVRWRQMDISGYRIQFLRMPKLTTEVHANPNSPRHL
jgi:Protein of unknown function (DUF2971)